MANGISQYDPGQELSSLNFGNLIGGPLKAVVEAQILSAEATVDYIKNVGFDANNEPEYVTFNYPKEIVPYQPGTPSVLEVDKNSIVGNSGTANAYNVAPLIEIVGDGQGAKAEAVIENGAVVDVIISDQGFGYTSTPTLTFLKPGGSGATFKIDSVDNDGRITKVSPVDKGTDYTHPPILEINKGSSMGNPAVLSINIIGGKVDSVEIVDPGSGYATTDSFTVTDPEGDGATASLILKTGNPMIPARYQDMELKVPLLTMVPIPFIRIEETTIDFNAKINSVESFKTESEFGIDASLTIDSQSTSSTSNYSRNSKNKKRRRLFNRQYKTSSGSRRTVFNVSASYKRKSSRGTDINKTYTMGINIKAVQDELPVGMEKVLGILENAVVSTPETS